MARIIDICSLEEKAEVYAYLKGVSFPTGYSKDQKKAFRRKCERLVLVNDTIAYRKPDGVLLQAVFGFESDRIRMILSAEHLDCHAGITKLSALIHRKYYGIPEKAIRDFVNECPSCQNFQPLRTIQELNLVQIRAKYDRYVIDCIDLRRYREINEGYSWILNVIDSYTKFLWSYKLRCKTASEVVTALEQCFINYGVPRAIQADNGKEFANALLKALCLRMSVQIIHGRPRHPQAQGMVERVNQTVKRWLAKVLHDKPEKKWIDYHDKVVYKYNTFVHRATGKSPFRLFFGKEGYNEPVLLPEIDEYGQAINARDEDATEDTVDNEWILEIAESGNLALTNPVIQPPDVDISEEYIHQEVLAHFETYRDRVVANANSNTVNRPFDLGDRVLVKRDFDSNQRTRRYPFDSFYEDAVFVVKAYSANNRLVIENENTRELKNVTVSQVKKLI